MTAITEPATGLADPAVRSNVYHLFALGFKYPTREIYELYQSREYLRELMDQIAMLHPNSTLFTEEEGLAEKVGEELRGIVFEDFETSYVGTFDAGFPEPACPPYEGVYNKAMPRTEVMLEVGAFYEHFGLGMSQEESKRELPDYLCAELEFLHFLAFQERRAREEGEQEYANGYLLAQKDFLERHMIPWLPQFEERLQGVEDLPFYPDLARILIRFVNDEFALLRTAVN